MIAALALAGLAAAAPSVEYDPGDQGLSGADRPYTSAADCGPSHPCQITLNGAFRFDFHGELPDVDFYYHHQGQQRPLQLFQRPAEIEHSAVWLAAHRIRNDVVINFDELLEDAAGERPEIFVYGIDLEYPLDNADLIYIEVHRDDSPIPDRYYFRFWDTRLGYSLDLTTLYAMRWLAAEPVAHRLDAATVTLAVSLRVFRRTEPDAPPGGLRFLLGGLHPTVMVGAFNELTLSDGLIVKRTDGFVGGGLTVARFAGLGVAVTVLDPAHGTFPYVALHLDEAVRVLVDASTNRPALWARYEAREARARRSGEEDQLPNSSRR